MNTIIFRQKGTATVEMAIILPLLLLLMLTAGEFGRAFFQYNTLTKTIRDGARYVTANVYGSTGVAIITDQVKQNAKELVVYGNISGSGESLLPGLTMDMVDIDITSGNHIKVRVENYFYNPMFGKQLPAFGFGSPISMEIPLRAAVTMRALL